MTPSYKAERKVLDAEKEGRTLRLFVQARSHKPALYFGRARVKPFEGSGLMQVELKTGVTEAVMVDLGVGVSED